MKNLKVQLAYKLGGFTDKDNIKILKIFVNNLKKWAPLMIGIES